jgi:hypothetical protein
MVSQRQQFGLRCSCCHSHFFSLSAIELTFQRHEPLDMDRGNVISTLADLYIAVYLAVRTDISTQMQGSSISASFVDDPQLHTFPRM